MFEGLTTLLLEGIRTHGILAVILGVMIETVIVPLPSPLIMMAAGVLLVDGGLAQVIGSILLIAIIAGLAQTFGSFLVYGLSYRFGKPFITKYDRYHGVTWKDIQTFEHKLSKREFSLIVLMRAIPIIPLSVISGVCGVLRTPVKKYTFATFLGVLPRNVLLITAGFLLQEIYLQAAGFVDQAETIMMIVILLLCAGYIVGKRTGYIDRLRDKLVKYL